MLKFGFIILGIVFSFYVFYSCSARYLKIKDLPSDVISSSDRLKYLGVLQKYILASGGCLFIDILTLLSPVLELRFLIPIVSLFVCTFIFMNLSDEIADFDISKKDSDIVQAFLDQRKNISKSHAKENKIKKIDIDELGISEDSDKFNIDKQTEDAPEESSKKDKE